MNGNSYVLIEESYEKRAQQPWSARFATGDPSEGDNSFWQFLSQKGWTGEGQEKFETVTKFRQSAGWDLRRGRPYMAKTIEAVTLNAALPAPLGVVVAGTEVLYDDFEIGSIDTGKWNANASLGGGLGGINQGIATVASSYRARSGWKNDGGGGTGSGTIPARCPSLAFDFGLGYNGAVNMMIRDDSTMSATGTWEFTIYTETSGVNKVHGAFAFLYGASGGYVLEIYGSDMTLARLVKSSASGMNHQASDTVLKTFDGTGGTTAPVGGSASVRTYKITRNSSGDFEVFENAVSLGTVTDTTYSTVKYLAFSTLLGVNGNSVNFTIEASTWIDNVKIPSLGSGDVGTGAEFINYNNGLWTAYYTADAAFTQTAVKTASLASNYPAITHVNARDIAVWSRDGNPTAGKNVFLATCRGQVLRCYNGNTQVYTGATTCYGAVVIPITSKILVVAGTAAENSGVPIIEIVTFNAELWTVASQEVLTLDGGSQGAVIGSAALDSTGQLYLAISDLNNTQGTIPSRLFIISSADLLSTTPTITSMQTFSDFVIRGMFVLAGSVYLHGARVRGNESFASVVKYPSTVMWESTLGKTLYPVSNAVKFNHGVVTTWKNIDNVLFLGMNDLALWDPVLQLDVSGNVLEVASFDSKQFTYSQGNPIAIAEWGGQFYIMNAQAGTIKRTGTSRGALGNSFATTSLQLSDMGSNTSLINKTLNSVLIELSAAMPAAETMSIYVNDTLVGTLVTADGTRKEITLSAELTSSVFTMKITLLQSATWTGYVKAAMLKFVPTQFKKRAWGFGIRATKRLKFGDGTHESRAPTTIFSDIETAWASNIPVTFVDVDGTSYSVLVTDFKQKRPLLQIDRSSEQEAFFFLELLQI